MRRTLSTLVGALALLLSAHFAQADPGDVRLILPAVAPSQGTPFDVVVTIDVGSEVLGAYELRVEFDTNHIEFVSSSPGLVAGFGDPIRISPTDLANGVLRFGAYQRASRTQPTGELTLATLRFTALGLPGSPSTLDISVLKLLDPLVDDLPAQAFDAELVVNSLALGDVNGDGVANQISDAVFLTRALLGVQVLDPTQRSASDVNTDGIAETVADLVFLINAIIGVQPSMAKAGSADAIAVSLGDPVVDGDWSLIPVHMPAEFDLGAALIRLELDSDAVEMGSIRLGPRAAGMNSGVGRDRDDTVILVYSHEGTRIEAGAGPLLWIPVRARSRSIGSTHDGLATVVSLSSAASADALGRAVRTSAVAGSARDVATPGRLALTGNVPNPFNPRTRIYFDLPSAARTRLTIYDVAGRRVARLVDRELSAGRYAIEWDATDSRGASVASGVYFVRLEAAAQGMDQRKMVLLR